MSHVELTTTLSNRKTSRLEVPVAVGIITEAVTQVHVADNNILFGIDHRDRVLRTVGD